MNILGRIINKIRKVTFSKLYRNKLKLQYKAKLKNDNFSIICNNCYGGILYHDLGKKFLSPTINMYIDASEYIEFLENFEFYLKCDMEDGGMADPDNGGGAIGILNGKIKLHGIHYSSFEELRDKWMERRERVNFDNLFIIGVYRDGCNDELVERFCNLPFDHKVFLSHKNIECKNSDCIVKVNCGRKAKEVPAADKMYSCKMRLYDKSFDFVSWLNS